MIYTSYFANLKKLPSLATPISICGKAPDWWTGLQYKKLAPKWSFFKTYKETGDKDYYIENFNKLVLDTLNQNDVVSDLESMSDNGDIVLLCYEKPGDFCHRHLVAKWLNEADIACKEFDPSTYDEPKEDLLSL